MKLKILNIVIIAVIALTFRINIVFAHGGVDDEPPEAVKAVKTDSATTKLITTDNIEVLIKYPELKLKEPVPFQVFVTDFKTNKPLINLDVDLAFKGFGKTIKANAKQTTTQGLYQTAVTFDTPGSYNLTLDIAGTKVNEHLTANGFEIKNNFIAGSKTNGFSWFLLILEFILALLLIFAIYLFISVSKKQQRENTL